MTFQELKDSFYHSILSELRLFAQTEANKNIYAIAFDCNSEVGQVSLRYGSNAHFKEISKNFHKVSKYYRPYGRYGLRGQQYDVGEFVFIGSLEHNGYIFLNFDSDTSHFFDSYYYHNIGDYFGEGEPIEGFDSGEVLNRETVTPLFQEMVIDCINRLKENGGLINTTEDFIIFMCDLQNSPEENAELLKKTVDPKLFDKLMAESEIKD